VTFDDHREHALMDNNARSDGRQAERSPLVGAGWQTVRWLTGALGPLLALAVVVAVFGVLDHWKHGDRSHFFSLANLHLVSVQTAGVAIAALGMTIIIISGGIDLSAGTALALAATVLAYTLKHDYGPLAAILAGIGTGCLAGLINGTLVAGLRMVPFIITLGTMKIYLGVAKIVAEETTVRPAWGQIPDWLMALVTTQPKPAWLIPNVLPNLAGGVWLALALAAGVAIVLRYTVFGRYVFALGSNESTARLCGVNVPLMKVAVYTLAGVFVGIAGILQFARISVGNPGSGIGLELSVIAALVIGGGSLNGGRGSILGTLAGAAMVEVINSGVKQMGWGNPIQDIAIGSIIIGAVTFDKFRQREGK
jgi:ribose transport system permease protein